MAANAKNVRHDRGTDDEKWRRIWDGDNELKTNQS